MEYKYDNMFSLNEVHNIVDHDMYDIKRLQNIKYIVDVGGNLGGFTIACSNHFPNAEIIVIEPDPVVMAMLKENTKNCTAKIHYVEKACTNTTGFVTLVKPQGWSTSNFIRGTGFKTPLTLPQSEIQVVADTLLNILFEHHFPRIDLLKMDAEGVEAQILCSMKSWLNNVNEIRGEWHGDRGNIIMIRRALQDTHNVKIGGGVGNGDLTAHKK